MEWKPYLRKAQFYETDSMGVVYHGNYIHWMEEARTDFLEQIGWGYEKATAAGIDFALEMKVRKLTPARLVLEYRMTDAETGELHTLGTSTHFFYDRKTEQPVALKKVFPELYELLQECVEKS